MPARLVPRPFDFTGRTLIIQSFIDTISTCFSWDSGSRGPPDPLVSLVVISGDVDVFRVGGCVAGLVAGLVAGDAFMGGALGAT